MPDSKNALSIAMDFYDDAASEPETALAAFGIAVAIVSNSLHVSMKQAVKLVNEELERRKASGN